MLEKKINLFKSDYHLLQENLKTIDKNPSSFINAALTLQKHIAEGLISIGITPPDTQDIQRAYDLLLETLTDKKLLEEVGSDLKVKQSLYALYLEFDKAFNDASEDKLSLHLKNSAEGRTIITYFEAQKQNVDEKLTMDCAGIRNLLPLTIVLVTNDPRSREDLNDFDRAIKIGEAKSIDQVAQHFSNLVTPAFGIALDRFSPTATSGNNISFFKKELNDTERQILLLLDSYNKLGVLFPSLNDTEKKETLIAANRMLKQMENFISPTTPTAIAENWSKKLQNERTRSIDTLAMELTGNPDFLRPDQHAQKAAPEANARKL